MDLRKYDVPVPRYTSYPTVPFWDAESFSISDYKESVRQAYWKSGREVSIYIHLPFCESLCTYCACNTRITKNHSVEEKYISYVLREWKMYLEVLPDIPVIREVHLGGGTPTFFSAENLELLINGLFENALTSSDIQMSFEGHPGNTTRKHLEVLYQLGFKRLSLGIQDFDLGVQKLINRLQSVEQVQSVVNQAREIGYTSVNFDMVYGLPGQTLDSLEETLSKVALMRPDRIAYYSYAHVPKLRPAQRSYEAMLPKADEKYQLMKRGKEELTHQGYEEVGMDHFILPGDELLEARNNGDLHRNFMGYMPFSSYLLMGLGCSSISDSWTGFAQNEKVVEEYYAKIDENKLPISRGHNHIEQDIFYRKHILNLMCDFQTNWTEEEFLEFGLSFNFPLLNQFVDEGYISYDEFGMRIMESGYSLIRIICSALDARMNSSGKAVRLFSQSI